MNPARATPMSASEPGSGTRFTLKMGDPLPLCPLLEGKLPLAASLPFAVQSIATAYDDGAAPGTISLAPNVGLSTL
jgi:hypothetical protein